MKLTKLYIENFKSFEGISINFNKSINIFTGINNAGKTTILESIALWCECFNILIKQSQKSIPNISISKGDYKLGDSNASLIDYREIISVRSPSFEDIFYNLDTSKEIILRGTLKDHDVSLDIGFLISKSTGGTNYRILLENYKTFDFPKFNSFFSNFPNPISVIYASPINSILPYEEFETVPKIINKVKRRETTSILRNRLYQLKKDTKKITDFLNDLSYILNDKNDIIELNIIGDEYKDVDLPVNIKIGGKDIEKGLSLLGSGTLQIIEILLSLYEEYNNLHIILLDEPDSHIHRDIQKRLINILTRHTSNAQIFLTTHNESLIRSSKPENLFYLEKNTSKEYFPIIHDSSIGVKIGLQPSKHIKILANLGSESGLDLINALESDKLILVEGQTDAQYIQTILEKTEPTKKINVMYWSFDGIDNLLPKLKAYKDFFSLIKNGKSLWDKSILVFDSDYITNSQRDSLSIKIEEQYGIKNYIWHSYTLESSILTDLDEFKREVYSVLKTLSTSDIDSDELSTYIDTIISNIAQELINKLDQTSNNTYNTKLAALIKTRKEKVDDVISNYQIFKSNEFLFTEYLSYSKSLLNDNKIYHLADKDMVKSILNTIFTHYCIDVNDTIDIFEFFISNISRGEWINEWHNLTSVINSL